MGPVLAAEVSQLYDVVVVEVATGRETSRFPLYGNANALAKKWQSEIPAGGRFICAGPCWTLDCECRELHGLSIYAKRPPVHEGCTCVLEPGPAYRWEIVPTGEPAP